MDYTKNVDLTINSENGEPATRRYKTSGKKIKLTCKLCSGCVTQYIEDTVYICRIHKIGPSSCDSSSGMCKKPTK